MQRQFKQCKQLIRRWGLSLLSLLLTVLFHGIGIGGLFALAAQPGLAQQPSASQALARSAEQNYASGNYEAAIEQWSAARQQLQATGDVEGVSRLLIFEAQALESLGQSRRACNTLLRALDAEATSCNELRLAGGSAAIASATEQPAEAVEDLGANSAAASAIELKIFGLPQSISGRNQVIGWRLLGESLQLVGQLDIATAVLAQSQQAALAQGLATEAHRATVALANGQATRLRGQDLNTVQEQLSSLPIRRNNPIQPTQPLRPESDYVAAVEDLLSQYRSLAESPAAPPLTQLQVQVNEISIAVEGTETLLNGLALLQEKAALLDYEQLLRSEFFAKQGGLLELSQTWMQSAAERFAGLGANTALAQGDRPQLYARLNLAQTLLRYEKLRQRQPLNTAKLPVLIEPAQAIANLETILQQAKANQDLQAEAYSLGYLGEWLTQTGNLAKAKRYTRDALALSQSRGAADLSYRFQWNLGQIARTENQRPQAKQAYKAAVESLDQLRNDLVATNRDVQYSFRDSVEPVYREYIDLLLDGEAQSRPADLVEARKTIQRLQLAEVDNYFREACALERASLDATIQQSDQKTAAIYSLVRENQLELLLKLPPQDGVDQPLQAFRVNVPRNRLTQVVNAAVIGSKTTATPQEGNEASLISDLAQLHRWLIEPLQSQLEGIETLVFVLDGPLSAVPMAALYDNQTGRFLVQDYGVAVAPGIELAVGKNNPEADLSLLAAGLGEGQEGYDELPFVEQEIEYLRRQTGSSVLFNDEFTPEQLKSSIRKRDFSIVHFATHGVFGSTADKTFLLAWESEIKVNQLSSLLQNQQQRQRTPLDLLVLSACQTAEGDARATLGIAGTAFRAGAQSILASLWSVNDESTAALIERFYEQLLNQEKGKAEALRQAQIELIEAELPVYQWAPFILVGQWS